MSCVNFLVPASHQTGGFPTGECHKETYLEMTLVVRDGLQDETGWSKTYRASSSRRNITSGARRWSRRQPRPLVSTAPPAACVLLQLKLAKSRARTPALPSPPLMPMAMYLPACLSAIRLRVRSSWPYWPWPLRAPRAVTMGKSIAGPRGRALRQR